MCLKLATGRTHQQLGSISGVCNFMNVEGDAHAREGDIAPRPSRPGALGPAIRTLVSCVVLLAL